MKTIAILVPAAAFLLSGAAAFADEYQTDAGRIMGMNAQTGAIQLDDGHSYTISNPVLLNGVNPGEHVIVTVSPSHTVGFQEDTGQFDGSGQQD
ncbi:hypothetical protein OSH11_00625 [Kaistia dalseonensis]|uniref:DUF1344 domain-containing protein n=1 Tax=Kaistia dalseonensis TaxID=410840 RepID=A0ABU0H0B2_9HYPH|nr:hypothetical protein [Kaistia dalseonensis]MCX5493198.1 hypothetical protein [Kaistia dalseonensis]MDQ0435753.1 hypothetical protein [Kaistia dalseonensis]